MSAIIKNFPGVEFIDQSAHEQPQADVIELLETYLERAESGELQALALVGICSDTALVTEYAPGSGCTRHSLVTGLASMQHKIIRDLDDDFEEDEKTSGT
jgi:hypothetical protein